jgi:hypothetical protein
MPPPAIKTVGVAAESIMSRFSVKPAAKLLVASSMEEVGRRLAAPTRKRLRRFRPASG